MRIAIAVLAALMVFPGCGSAKEAVKAVSLKEPLTAEEIAATNSLTAYEAVERLRPNFLRSRFYKPVVYVDNMRYGGLSSLYYILATDVEEIRFISAVDATTRWGTGHGGGVVLVTTKK